MARAGIERFLEIAPVPLGLPVEEVERRLGPAGRVLEKFGRPIGFQYPDRGVWLAAEDGVITSVSFLTGTPEEGGARFAGDLPSGLSVDDPPSRVRELFGEPDRTQEIALPRPAHAKLSLWFYELNAPAMLTFAIKSAEAERLDRIVLARRPTP